MSENQATVIWICAVIMAVCAVGLTMALWSIANSVDEWLSRIRVNLSKLDYLPNIASHLKDMAEPDEDDCDGEEDDDAEQTYTITVAKKERE